MLYLYSIKICSFIWFYWFIFFILMCLWKKRERQSVTTCCCCCFTSLTLTSFCRTSSRSDLCVCGFLSMCKSLWLVKLKPESCKKRRRNETNLCAHVCAHTHTYMFGYYKCMYCDAWQLPLKRATGDQMLQLLRLNCG